MNEIQNDPIVKKKRVKITPIGYASLNKLYDHFVPQKELSAEQAFWLPISKTVSEQPPVQPKPVQNDIPLQLPTTSMVKQNILKEKSHLDNFEKVKKVRTKVTGQNEGTSGFKHIKGDFEKDVIPIVKSLRESFADFKLEQARALQPLDNALDYACKFTTQIQELLVYVSATCPSFRITSEKLVVVTPMNKNKQVRVKSSTNASGSNPRSNTRNNRISRTSSSNMKNKEVEDHPRNVKSSLNNMNCVCICNVNVKHVVLNANSKFVCSTSNECIFLANHDMCVVDYLNDVNSCTSAKSVKSNIKNKWKPTGKVFTNVGHRLLPTGRTFTIYGTKYPLTRITSTKIVPLGKPVQTKLITKTPPSSVSQGKPNETKTGSSSSKPRIEESRHSNN
ncbi:hypothetical protein Tco_0478507 [Tanacetum coccineum]